MARTSTDSSSTAGHCPSDADTLPPYSEASPPQTLSYVTECWKQRLAREPPARPPPLWRDPVRFVRDEVRDFVSWRRQRRQTRGKYIFHHEVQDDGAPPAWRGELAIVVARDDDFFRLATYYPFAPTRLSRAFYVTIPNGRRIHCRPPPALVEEEQAARR